MIDRKIKRQMAELARPEEIAEIKGQDLVVREILDLVFTNSFPQIAGFCGSTGCGKSTIAGLLPSVVNCEKYDFRHGRRCRQCQFCRRSPEQYAIRFNCPREGFSGAVARHLDRAATFAAWITPGVSALIFEEIQAWSKREQAKLLHALECKINMHTLVLFTTTDQWKLIRPLRGRVAFFNLRRLSLKDTFFLLRGINEKHRLSLSTSDIKMFSKVCNGDARWALNNILRLASRRKHLPRAAVEDLLDGLEAGRE